MVWSAFRFGIDRSPRDLLKASLSGMGFRPDVDPPRYLGLRRPLARDLKRGLPFEPPRISHAIALTRGSGFGMPNVLVFSAWVHLIGMGWLG